MPQPYAWVKLKNVGQTTVSARSGHTMTQTEDGAFCFGGMDGRKNDSGLPVPNNDLYQLKLKGAEGYEWSPVELDASSPVPPARTLHTATRLNDHEVFVFGGIHSASPHQCLNDAWVFDTSQMVWSKIAYKIMTPGGTKTLPKLTNVTADSVRSRIRSRSSSGLSDASMRSSIPKTGLAAARIARQASKSSRPGAWHSILKAGGSQAGAATPSGTIKRPNNQGSVFVDDKDAFYEDLINLVNSEGTVPKETNAPPPRANHSLNIIGDKHLYLFGGHGGKGYQRRAFNDVWVYSLEDEIWTEMQCQGNPPNARSGHGAFAKGDTQLFVFGGWNSEAQFNDLFMLDIPNKDWSDLDMSWSVPRWNLTVELVKAIPNWKAFLFGGAADTFSEGRSMGVFDNKMGILDLGDKLAWSDQQVQDISGKENSSKQDKNAKDLSNIPMPPPREHASMFYEDVDSRIVVFGGWSNKWLDDMWALNVSSIVGPPYAISSVEPKNGPVTGGETIQIRGIGFNAVDGIVTVKFQSGKLSVEAPGTVIDDTLMECITPNILTAFGGPKKTEVRFSIGSKDYTNSMAGYEFYINTSAEKSVCVGPGILEDGEVGKPTKFVLVARNGSGENRTSGRDKVTISIVQQRGAEIPFELRDMENGNYVCTYTSSTEGDVAIKVGIAEIPNGPSVPVGGSPFKATFTSKAKPNANIMTGPNVIQFIANSIKETEAYFKRVETGLAVKLRDNDVVDIIKVVQLIKDVSARELFWTLMIEMGIESCNLIEKDCHPHAPGAAAQAAANQQILASAEKSLKSLKKLSDQFSSVKHTCKLKEREISPMVSTQAEVSKKEIVKFEEDLKTYQAGLRKEAYFLYKSGKDLAIVRLDSVTKEMNELEKKLDELGHVANSFDYPDDVKGSRKLMQALREDLTGMRILWDFELERLQVAEKFLVQSKAKVKADEMEEEIKGLFKKLREIKVDKKCDAYLGILDGVKKWLSFCPLVGELRDPGMRDRHWDALMKLSGKKVKVTEDMPLNELWNMELYKSADAVLEITDQAKQEAKMEKTLAKLKDQWSQLSFVFDAHKTSPNVKLMRMADENFEMLEEHQVQVQNMFASRFLATFETEVVYWQKTLANIAEITNILSEVQRTWAFLENLFIFSEEVKKELPEQTEKFVLIDVDVKKILARGEELKLYRDFCSEDGMFKRLESVQNQLTACEKALNDFMDGKRRAFPRWYFVSTVDLLDILSNGNTPSKVMVHMSKFFQCINTYDLKYPNGQDKRPIAVGLDSCVGKEYVPFPEPLPLEGKVEEYMGKCIGAFRDALSFYAKKSLKDYEVAGPSGRGKWVTTVVAAQCALLVNMITWVRLVEAGFESYKNGNKEAISTAKDQMAGLLLDLIRLTQTDLDKPTRQKVMCMITLDAHNRDIQERLVSENVISKDAFQWQAQLKAHWHVDKEVAIQTIADAKFDYGLEYLGNGPRLVVTPLTDRIYVTATQALHLHMGCAPAGPAGTGKTETTKDLANALAKACYVFNAAPEMDYQTMGSIFKGTASGGTWACFDEFNRLIPEVLSVCTVQFKAVTDAIKAKTKTFFLQGDEIALDPSCGAFITMNPGYLGRSELPEGLKALFRPITVMVPDFALIMENMFMAEGFLEAKLLAKKFSTLYFLCQDLLSKAKQYDWGMRAIKSVLVVAGGFKRQEPSLSEQAVLMRSLRDTNVAKIDGDDLKIFMGLLSDLFPGIDVPRAREMTFEDTLIQTMEEGGLTHDKDGYLLLKITQLIELLAIRHCIFLIGPPGSFKSALWRVLAKAKDKINEKTTWVDLNPKAISTSELYGYVNMQTREWKDGILSKTMRSLGQIGDTLPKWIILDGDLDAQWVESMNSVMDDNKLLTLPSNERIPLKPHMRMIFEIRDLNFATPATVTRAGVVLMVDYHGVQWRSYRQSWIKRITAPEPIKEQLMKLFDKYLPDTLLYLKKQCKVQVPIVEISLVQSLCMLLESFFDERTTTGQAPLEKDALESWFVFCTVWAVGGSLAEVDGVDYRKQFSNWWKQEMKTIKFPSKGTVFDYYIQECKLEEWSSMMQTIEYNSETPMGQITVPTTETVAMMYFLKALIKIHQPVMLIGLAGCGKTQLGRGLLRELKPDIFTNFSIYLNYYTDSAALQGMMETPLEKKAGKLYAPPGKLNLIYFFDDLNMPALDPYNTQSAISLLRQKQDYGHWYDRQKITLKDIGNTQYMACMNPTAGSFVIDERLQRHFWTCAVPFPEQSALQTIYQTFMKGHFDGPLKFKPAVTEAVGSIIKAALSLHASVAKTFRKTAAQFHYEFNIRHLSGVFGGLLQAKPTDFTDGEKIALLWIHESERVYGDRLVSISDLKKYRGLVGDLVKKSFPKFNFTKYFQEKSPEALVFAPFSKGLEEACYDKIPSVERLSELLTDALKEYNETNAAMDLVLFEDAMKHVAKIARITAVPSGHALLVGVGGSGRQSLSRLSGFINRLTTSMIVISGSYGISDLKTDLQTMYNKAGVKDEGLMFLFTDGQITNEKFLVYINDLLASGDIADLYAQEDKDNIRNAVRSACKSSGTPDTPENLWNFFISRIRKNLHMAICFSPVGDAMRSRARKFPALVNCTVIDWFQPWPKEALRSVAAKFLETLEPLGAADSNLRKGITDFMPFSFDCVGEKSQQFIQVERRYAYTTPKSFLELVKLYINKLGARLGAMEEKQGRLISGLEKLKATQESVALLEIELKEKAVVVEEKAKAADIFAEEVGREKAKVNAEAEKANVEKEKCETIATAVTAQRSSCEQDLEKAIPLVEKAEAALDVLNKKDFQELKSFAKPPPGVDKVCETVLHLMAGIDPNIEVDKKGKVKDPSWKGSLKMMGNPEKFLENLKSFKKEIDDGHVAKSNIENARPLTLAEDFTVESMTKKSKAAAGLCEWVLNIIMYYDVVISVEPKKLALKEATNTLNEANNKLAAVQALVADLEAKLARLIADFDAAIAEKNAVLAEAQKCKNKLEMAQRLIGALGANGVIWEQTVQQIAKDVVLVPGDVLVACSFVSYLGVFTRTYRDSIVSEFVKFLRSKQVPLSHDCDPLKILTNEAEIAKWATQGLPSDRVSCENGAIMTNSERWCLMVDPQLQGILWVKNREASNNLQITRMGHAKMVQTFEASIDQGKSVLIENMGESIDAVLAPVVGRNTIKRGRSKVIKLGDKEISYNPNFRLFMQTKLGNPHYPPEVQAECTIINFTVTEQGLEEQLLFLVVGLERPDLAKQKSDLIVKQNEFKVKLAELEALLLEKLANSTGDILDDVDLILSLEEAKKTSDEVKEKVIIAQETEAKINETSESYRPVASRGALMFFLLMDLNKIHSFYKFSLDAFVSVCSRAINSLSLRKPKQIQAQPSVETKTEAPAEGAPVEGGVSESVSPALVEAEEEPFVELMGKDLVARVELLLKTVTKFSFSYTRRGLFNQHKLIVSTMLCLRVLYRGGKITQQEMDTLIRAPPDPTAPTMPENCESWISPLAWAQLKSVESIAVFKNSVSGALTQNMEADSLSWKRWFSEERAETADLPRSFRELSPFHRLILLRVLRPDRLSSALIQFVGENLGPEFVEQAPFDMDATYKETTSLTPFFFVLFPGVDPTPLVESMAKKLDITAANGKFVNMSMGQGQETIAINALNNCAKVGGWIMLQNIHLMQSWLKTLERSLELIEDFVHPDFRCILTSEPPNAMFPLMEIIPEAILQKCVKIADEAPQDIKSNLRRAWSKFNQDAIDHSSKQREFKACLFGLCFFHSLVIGRKRFGAQGWSRAYPFNDGDLTICAAVLHNYLEKYENVPWPDLRYIFGEIMYGGHITDRWDRRTNNTYLNVLFVPELLANMNLAPGFRSPDAGKMDYSIYSKYIEERVPNEIPQMFGLHPNAEIGFLTSQGVNICNTILEVQGGSSKSGGGDSLSGVGAIMTAYLSQLPKNLDMIEIRAKVKDWSPYVIVSLQESERMNMLLGEIRRSLTELEMGLSGALNVSEQMEALATALSLNRVPATWEKLAYFSLKPLAGWYNDLLKRVAQLVEWTNLLGVMKSLWISGLFNPMSYLTAVMQVTARKFQLPLDYMTNRCTFTNYNESKEIKELPTKGVYVHGFFMEGAGWEAGKGEDEGYITESVLKELHPPMPVVNVFAVHVDLMSWDHMYHCPVFVTSMRGPTFVFIANVKMDADDTENRWVLAGAALLLTDD